MTKKELLKIIDKAKRNGEETLDLRNRGLTELPAEIGQLTNLTILDLEGNRLTVVPAELGQLTNLRGLDLIRNRLTAIPAELGQLTNLTKLYLQGNQLTAVPAELLQLTNLTELHLNSNQLTAVPAELGQLTNLTKLYLQGNQLTAVPAELGQLTNLTELHLNSNQLTAVPAELGRLANLRELYLPYNQLTAVPAELGQLKNLATLDLDRNQLTVVPAELGQLANLTALDFRGNQLKAVPAELGQLTNLTRLFLQGNQLTAVPAELGQLTNLTRLDFRENQITTVPAELGQLTNLEDFYIFANPLASPPPEIVAQGTQAILEYLRGLEKESTQQWTSKLVVVGEGGVGKTSLLKALLDEPFNSEEETTHGIAIRPLELAHPNRSEVPMHLHTWDFGGQEIYHATHQFFLTNRSLFLLLWNARHGHDQGRLHYWLDTIQALAPDSPILLIATHIDEREAIIPFKELKEQYPQLVGHFESSSKTRAGIEELKEALAKKGASLPLMGELWPTAWLNGARALQGREEKFISHQKLSQILTEAEVEVDSQATLTQWLHELGQLLYFPDREDLKDFVVLKPEWVSEYISKVLESPEVIRRNGVFTKEEMECVWEDLSPEIRTHLLNLMERFDLSYRTLEDKEISLVVERLPVSPPEFQAQWDSFCLDDQRPKQIVMKYVLNSIPAGIPTWFIARAHRFTTHTQWRSGALFEHNSVEGDDHGEGFANLGLVEADARKRSMRLSVRGPHPENFLALLRDGLELTLARFPGLEIKRTIPCPGHDSESCSHEFDYGQLLKRFEKEKLSIECPEAMEPVSVTRLLYGWDWSTKDEVLNRLDELGDKFDRGNKNVVNEVKSLREYTQREFLNVLRREQANVDLHCPNVFVLRPFERKQWTKKVKGKKWRLQLYCEAPGQWHIPNEGGLYELEDAAKWLKVVGPYVSKLVDVLKFAAPLIGSWLNYVDKDSYEKIWKDDLDFMKELVAKLPNLDLGDDQDADPLSRKAEGGEPELERVEGAALRQLRRLLEAQDPAQDYGGLRKTLTPEGHILWLCDHHAQPYLS